MKKGFVGSTVLVACTSVVGIAGAAEKPPPAPYILPWALRPVIAPTVIRSDNTVATYDQGTGTGYVVVNGLTGAFKVPGTGGPTEGLGFSLRLTAVTDTPGSGAKTGFVIPNPVVGTAWAFRLPGGVRLNTSLAGTIPVGMGGGNTPDAAESNALTHGRIARSSMENSIYSVNDFAIFPGMTLAWVASGWTIQAELTFFFLTRVRGELKQPDVAKTNMTTGLFVGYFVVPKKLSLGAEFRYQRWLEPPRSVASAPDTLDTATVAGGLRYHAQLSSSTWLRCGISYARGIDDPMAKQNYNVFQLDCPLLF